MRILKTLAPLPALLAFTLSLPASDARWFQDMDAAKTSAAKGKLDLLLDFTGSDWCGWCIRLEQEVFSQEAFQGAAPKDFVLVKIDFPRDQTSITPAIRAQNERLSQQYGIEGYPTIILADAEGRPYAQTGYQEGGPEAYVAHLRDLRQRRVARDAAFAKAQSARGMDRARLLAEGLGPIAPPMQVAFYGPELDAIAAIDTADTLGFKRGLADAREAHGARRATLALQEKFERIAGPLMEKVGPMITGDKTAAALDEIDAWLKEHADAESLIRQQVAYLKVKIHGREENHAAALAALDDVIAIDEKTEFAAMLQVKLRPAIQDAVEKAKQGADSGAQMAQ